MANIEVEPATLTLEEAAKKLGIGRDLAYRLAKASRFPGLLRLGGKYVVSKTQLENFLSGTEGI